MTHRAQGCKLTRVLGYSLLLALSEGDFARAQSSGSIVGWGAQIVGVDLSAGFIKVAAGGAHSLGLKANGSIVAWGNNHSGESNVPVPNGEVIVIGAGEEHSLGLKADGSIVAWGWNEYRQTNVPVPNTGFVGIAAGDAHSLGLKGDGSVAGIEKSEDSVPEGLTDSDWKSIRQEYERHRHAAVAVDGEFRARNPGQQWLTHFDGRGFAVEPNAAGWRWGLELQSYGFPGHERAVSGQAKMTAQNDRVTYDWDAGLREWFVNDRSGLEHGFTLVSRPPGAGDPRLGAGDRLELRLAVRGGLLAQGHADGQGVSFVNQQGSAVVHYAGLKVWDADHRAIPARIDADATGLRLAVDERRARYALTIDPIAQQAYLKASNTDANDGFGISVAVSGDTVVVGAFGEDSNATGVNGNQADNSAVNSGAAYVFVKGGGGIWSQQAYLKASNTDANDWFGYSVAVSGDTVVVGAHWEDSNATGINGNDADNGAGDSGAAYVFVRDGVGVWTQQAYLKASNTGGNDEFGRSVGVSGNTVVVGAQYEDSEATGVNGNQTNNSAGASGAAYVFVRGGGVWSQQAYLRASNTDESDWFGYSVAVSGDTVVVGAFGEDSNATGVNGNQANNSALDSGAVYVFARDGASVWSQQTYLKASNTGAGDRFGLSVAVSGDTVVVGAFGEDSNATGVNGNQADNSAADAGAAYVFVRDGASVWSQQAYLKASNTGAGDYCGWSVAVSGDTVVVGADSESSNARGVNGNQADNNAVGSGAAYVFVRDGASAWSQQTYLKASNTGAGDHFGVSVAVSGDTVVVGGSQEDSNATDVNGNQADNSALDSGAAYVFLVPPIVCGDGVVEGAEQCDDGDVANGDGCSATCTVESGYTCDTSEPSVCTEDDECTLGTDNCDVNAACTNTPGSFTCTCNICYSGDGVSCQFDDADGDGVCDLDDICPGFDDAVDTDGDGVPDGCDNCPAVANLNQADADTDGVGDACDNCPTVANTNQQNSDTDTHGDDCDNCALVTNENQADSDADAMGDVCDNCALVANADQSDMDANGIGDACEPPRQAIAPHNVLKNRYVTFTPANPATPVAFRVNKLTPPIGFGWVAAPDADGNAKVTTTMPSFRVWSEVVVHVGDCEIMPVAQYEIRATTDGTVFTAPLVVNTIAEPVMNLKKWGDIAGVNNGSEWTAPNLFTNVNDILAVLAYISGAAIKPEFQRANLQAISSADPCLNAFVNTADVLILVKAVAGDAYPFTTNPANCPVCP